MNIAETDLVVGVDVPLSHPVRHEPFDVKQDLLHIAFTSAQLDD
jgi:hypothetical protein